MVWKHISIMLRLHTDILYERRGTVTAHFCQESRYPDSKRLIYLQGFDITWQTAPPET